jgi:hypothetical protein
MNLRIMTRLANVGGWGLQFLLYTDSTDEKEMRVTTPHAPTPFQNYEIPNIEIMIIRSTH